MFGVKLLLFLACLSWSQCKLDKYCSICSDHTMCKYQGVGKDCKNPGDFGVSERDIEEIVGTHNMLRGIVASGAEKKGAGGPQPKAANLMKLEWDHDLAKVAQRWADQCHFFHDTCRDDQRWKVGQNIYWAYKYPKHTVNWTEAIFSWYNEVSIYNPDNVGAYRFESKTGHYTQILWHDTTFIGCGRRDYGSNKLYVCNYGPAGNWVNEPLYEVGEACSKCPAGTFCNSYLCDSNNTLNSFRILPESGNETVNLKSLRPPEETAQDIYASENDEKTEIRDEDDAQQDDEFLQPLPISGSEIQKKVSTNLIDETGYELDPDIKTKIEEIQRQIENLVKTAVEKSNKKP